MIRILHVDDEPSHLRLTKMFIERSYPDLQFESVESPTDALKLIEEGGFDCVVADYQMPQLNGIELAKKVREISDVPFIIYTGRGGEEVAEAAFTVGIDDYIRKESHPSHFQVLAKRIISVVEKKNAEEKLRESEELYSNVMESMSDGIFTLDNDFRFTLWNRAMEETTGVSHEEIIGTGKTPWDVFSGGSSESVDEMMKRAMEGETVSRDEIPYQLPSGKRGYGAAIFMPLKAKEGDSRGIIGLIRDITAEKEMVEERKRVEERFRNLFELSPSPIAVTDMKGTVIEINEAALKLSGYSRHELVGKNFSELPIFHASDIPKYLKIFASIIRGKTPEPLEVNFITKDGRTVWALVHVGILEIDGKKVGIQTIFLDITSRKKMEEDLMGSEERMRIIFENAPDAIYMNDMAGTFIEGNRAAEEVTGYMREELIGKSFLSLNLLPAGQLPRAVKLLALNVAGKPTGPDEFTLNRKDGGKVDVEIRTFPVKLEQKSVVLGIARSISDRKRLSEAQEQYRDRIELLYQLASEMNLTTNIEEVAKVILDGVENIFGFQKTSFTVIDGDVLKPVEIRADTPPVRAEIPLDGEGIIAKVARTGVTVNLPDVREEPDYFMSRSSTRSELTVPVKIHGETVAVLNVESSEVDAFSGEDQKLMEVFAEHISSNLIRMRNLQVLTKREEEYRSFLESSRDAIFVISEGRFVYVNRQTIDLLGYDSVQDLTETPALLTVAPEDRSLAGSMIRERPRGVVHPSLYEIKLQKIDGSIIEVENHVSLIDFEGEKAALVYTRDITDRKRMEEELRQSEERYRSLVESSPSAISVTVGSEIVYVNRKRVELTGHSDASEIVGTVGLDNVVSDDADSIRERIQAQDRGVEYPAVAEFGLKRKDGSVIDVVDHTSNILWEGTEAVLHILQNVTERKHMENELRQSEERYRNLVELAPDGIVSIDLRGYVKSINKAFTKHTGRAPEDIVGRHITKIATLRTQDIPKYVKLFSSFVRGETIPPTEFVYKRNDGTLGWGEAHSRLVEIEESKKELLIVLREISDRKRMEEELQSYSDDLESLVEQRTRELLDAERMAAAGSIAAMVVHDLRNPVSSIRNALSLMELAPDKAEEAREIIDDAVDRTLRMLDELRDKTKDTPLKVETVDLGELLERTVKDTKIPDGIKVTMDYGDGLDEVVLDPLMIRRVLDNLIGNALDAMPKGGALTVKAETSRDETQIIVTDTGVGIAKAERENLFNPFYTTKPTGMGLGLAYCKRAVGAHKGTITVESREGKGTTFKVSIPHLS